MCACVVGRSIQVKFSQEHLANPKSSLAAWQLTLDSLFFFPDAISVAQGDTAIAHSSIASLQLPSGTGRLVPKRILGESRDKKQLVET